MASDQVFDYVLSGLLLFVGYILKDIHSSFKQHKKDSELQNMAFAEKIGINKGGIESVKQQVKSDLERIEQVNQLQLRQISKDVKTLTEYVHDLMKNK